MGKSFRKNSDSNKHFSHRNRVAQDIIMSGNFNQKQFGNGPRRARDARNDDYDGDDDGDDDDRFYR